MKLFRARCDNCGKQNRLIVRAWTTITDKGYDWEDYHSWHECFLCTVKMMAYSVRFRIKRKIRALKFAAQYAVVMLFKHRRKNVYTNGGERVGFFRFLAYGVKILANAV